MPIQCRFYEDLFPEVGDVVLVTVKVIQSMGSYVELLEYKNIGGMILHSELSRRRIRSISKLVRIGSNTEVTVVRVDSAKGYIDLSKRRASAEEIAKCKERFAKAKAILRNVAEKLDYKTDEQLEELCRKTAWYFDRKTGRRAGSYDIFKKVVNSPEILDECDIDQATKEMLLTDIRHRLTPKAVKIRADFEVSCFTYDGIDAVKSALRSGLELNSDSLPIRINLIAPPLYVLTTQTMDRAAGLEQLNEVLDVIKKSIESQGGSFKIQQAARVVSDTDDADLQRQMDELEKANREVSGDEDDEDEDDGDEEDDDEASNDGDQNGLK
ncbi:putative eukaryotic translation initiation factor 2 alpha subunit [Schistosoma mansoni]|uniref:putative eukaryotic translation initiation factor 2 alpha subunit n=1 Tax=Schistosoma mansoni TaxID=6183 RepID=UPI0001A62E90|nr:putative eukaryotic translation initiation factor 2 alpha subunit [Schistosoma mansoni]|eukprot:XP_018654592.1 putative eukaryotic translation initiation factor 2 alpha subunit [Schistosoma mansoni]